MYFTITASSLSEFCAYYLSMNKDIGPYSLYLIINSYRSYMPGKFRLIIIYYDYYSALFLLLFFLLLLFIYLIPGGWANLYVACVMGSFC